MRNFILITITIFALIFGYLFFSFIKNNSIVIVQKPTNNIQESPVDEAPSNNQSETNVYKIGLKPGSDYYPFYKNGMDDGIKYLQVMGFDPDTVFYNPPFSYSTVDKSKYMEALFMVTKSKLEVGKTYSNILESPTGGSDNKLVTSFDVLAQSNDLLPYFTDSSYCKEDSDCKYELDLCTYTIFNGVNPLMIYGCGPDNYHILSTQEEESCPHKDLGGFQISTAEVSYDSINCLNNKCVGTGRTVTCGK